MRTILTLLAPAALLCSLGACAPSDEQRASVRDHLPPGCTIRDLGQYGDVDDLIAIECDGRPTTTTTSVTTKAMGKTLYEFPSATVWIGPPVAESGAG